MADVSLQHIKKVYPHSESKKKKKGQPEKRPTFRSRRRVFWQSRISTWRSATGSSSCW